MKTINPAQSGGRYDPSSSHSVTELGDYLQLGVRNHNIQENDALVVKDLRGGVSNANPNERLYVNGNLRTNRFLTTSSQKWKTNFQTMREPWRS
jgi:hypothetical protein